MMTVINLLSHVLWATEDGHFLQILPSKRPFAWHKTIHIMLTDSLWSIIASIIIEKMSFYFPKHSHIADKSDAHWWTMIYVLQKQLSICSTYKVAVTRAELQYSGQIQIQKWPALFRNLQSFVDCSMERSIRYKFFSWSAWRAFNISSHLNIVWIYVSRAVFLRLMAHHFLHTSPYKMSVFERSVTYSFCSRNCTHILIRTQGKKFEYMFLIKIANKGTSLKSGQHHRSRLIWTAVPISKDSHHYCLPVSFLLISFAWFWSAN